MKRIAKLSKLPIIRQYNKQIEDILAKKGIKLSGYEQEEMKKLASEKFSNFSKEDLDSLEKELERYEDEEEEFTKDKPYAYIRSGFTILFITILTLCYAFQRERMRSEFYKNMLLENESMMGGEILRLRKQKDHMKQFLPKEVLDKIESQDQEVYEREKGLQ